VYFAIKKKQVVPVEEKRTSFITFVVFYVLLMQNLHNIGFYLTTLSPSLFISVKIFII